MLTYNELKESSIHLSDTDVELKPSGTDGDRIVIDGTISAGKYAGNLDDSWTLTLTSYCMNTGTTETSVKTVPVKQYSKYLDDDSIGKIMGLFSNPLEDTPYPVIAAASITLALWILISAVTSSLVRKVTDTSSTSHAS